MKESQRPQEEYELYDVFEIKPKCSIKKIKGTSRWMCVGGGKQGYGSEWREAYSKWCYKFRMKPFSLGHLISDDFNFSTMYQKYSFEW